MFIRSWRDLVTSNPRIKYRQLVSQPLTKSMSKLVSQKFIWLVSRSVNRWLISLFAIRSI